MKFFQLLLCGVMLCCTSCRSNKFCAWDVVYQEKFQSEYDVYLLKSSTGGSLQFYVEFSGKPVCEVEVSQTATSAIVLPYRSCHEVDRRGLFYDGEIISSVSIMTHGENTLLLFDLNGDGYPEEQSTIAKTETKGTDPEKEQSDHRR